MNATGITVAQDQPMGAARGTALVGQRGQAPVHNQPPISLRYSSGLATARPVTSEILVASS